MKFEVVYWTKDSREVIEVESFSEARQVAKAKSRESGRTATVRRKRYTGWKILIVDIESGVMLDTGGSMTKFEASIVWRKWQCRAEKAVCVPWPDWVNWKSIRAG